MNKKCINSYLNLDCSNYFKESTNEEKDIIEFKNQVLDDYNKNENIKSGFLKEIISKYIEKYFPEEKDTDNFSLSLYLSKYFYKEKKLKKNSIEKNVNFFFNRRINITYSNTFQLNIEGMENIGNILSYAYVHLDSYKIKNKKELLDKINKSNQQLVNALTDFYNYCVNNNLPPNEENKSKFWRQNKKNYMLPAELLFIINLFNKVTIFDFDINFQDENFTETQFKYLILILMNLDIFLINFKSIKFNFIHEKFQIYYYSLYHKKVLDIMNPDSLKINYVKDFYTLYTRKWIFDKTFILDEYRNIEVDKKKKLQKKKADRLFEDFTIVQDQSPTIYNRFFLQKKDTLTDTTDIDSLELNNNYKSYNFHRNNTLQNNFDISSNNFSKNYKKRISVHDMNIDNYLKKKEKNNYIEAIEKYHYSFEILFILFHYISNYPLENIDLVMNDSYTSELLYYFKNYLKIDIKKENYNFHLLDLYTSTLNQLRSLNIEIDSFDLYSFDKILNLILINNKTKEIKLSFFTCDINYFPYTLLKTFYRFIQKTTTVENSENNEDIILEYFYPYFKNNLLFLLYLIKKKSFNKIGLNFDIPLLVQKKENYMMVILKFLLNILIYLNESICKVNVLTLLSPNTVLDGRLLYNIDKIFEDMEVNNKNMYLYELNIQFSIYKIPHITNIISRNLMDLNIGDLDVYTLESLVNYFHSYNFASLSLLRKLKIKLLNNIEILTPKLKIIFRSLFNIKLRNLKKLGLITNIIIKKEKECSYILKILNDNWISSYTLIFNKSSQEFFKVNANHNKISYLVPHNLENEMIGPDKLNNKNISTNPDDTVYWYLKYLFNNKYYYASRNFKAHKYYIYNILKYLYFSRKVNILFDIKSEEEEEENKK